MTRTVRTQGLSPSARRIVQTKRVRGRMKPKEWIRLFRELAAFDEVSDRMAEHYEKLWLLWARILVALLGALFVAWVVLSGKALDYVACGALGASIPLVILCAVHCLKYRSFKKRDLENGLRRVILPFLRDLAPDVHAGQKIRVALDLSPLDEPQKIVRKVGRHRVGSRELTQTMYRCPWAVVRLTLKSGAEISLALEDRLVQEIWSWRNLRNKPKSKIKYKRFCVGRVRLTPDPSRLQWDGTKLKALLSHPNVREKDRGGVVALEVRRTEKFKQVHSVPEGFLRPEDLCGMAMALHGALVPVRHR